MVINQEICIRSAKLPSSRSPLPRIPLCAKMQMRSNSSPRVSSNATNVDAAAGAARIRLGARPLNSARLSESVKGFDPGRECAMCWVSSLSIAEARACQYKREDTRPRNSYFEQPVRAQGISSSLLDLRLPQIPRSPCMGGVPETGSKSPKQTHTPPSATIAFNSLTTYPPFNHPPFAGGAAANWTLDFTTSRG